MKPQNELVKLEVAIDVSASNFDEERAESIAREVNAAAKNNKEKETETVFENDIVDRVDMVSVKVLREHECVVGAFNGKEMHLTSVKGNTKFIVICNSKSDIKSVLF